MHDPEHTSSPRDWWHVLAVCLILVALGVGIRETWHGVVRGRRMTLLVAQNFWASDIDSYDPIKKLPEEKQLFFYGDTSRNDKWDQQRAIWERDPKNRVLHGNYISYLLESLPYVDYEDNAPPDEEDWRTLADFEAEMRRAIKFEPDNARYNWMLAAAWLNFACSINFDSNPPTFTVHDRDLLDKAMREFRLGCAKPYYRRYTAEMYSLRMNLLLPPQNMEQMITQLSIGAGVILPDLSHLRNTMRVLEHYTLLLRQENKNEEADELVRLWAPFALKVNDDAWCLIDVLVTAAIVKLGSNAAAAQLPEETSESTLAHHQALLAGFNAWRGAPVSLTGNPEKYGSFAATLLLPQLRGMTVSRDDLRPQRRIEQVILEQGVATAGIALFSLLILSGLLAVPLRLLLRDPLHPFIQSLWTKKGFGIFVIGVLVPALVLVTWYFIEKPRETAFLDFVVPLQLVIAGGLLALALTVIAVRARRALFDFPALPEGARLSVREIATIILCSVVLPVLLYALLTRYTPWAGREYSVLYYWFGYAAQWVVLLTSILTLSMHLTVARLAQRFERLGCNRLAVGFAVVPPVRLVLLLVILWTGAFALRPPLSVPKAVGVSALGIVCAGLLLNLAHSMLLALFCRRHPAWRRALLGGLARVSAMAILLLAFAVLPMLRQREAFWLRRDTLLGIDRSQYGFTYVESRITKMLQQSIRDGEADWQRRQNQEG